jgi:anti-sigma B factor antagonist
VNIEVISEPGRDPVVLRLNGRLDPTTTALLDRRLRALCTEGRSCFILGCAELAYLSSAGLKTLLSVRKLLAQLSPAGGIHLAAPKPHVLDVLQLSGLDACFPVHASIPAALAATAGAPA